MHPSAKNTAKQFFTRYIKSENISILDIGSYIVDIPQGSLRDVCPSVREYIGIDCNAGPGVDVVVENPYVFPFENEKFDVVVCSSVFEHSEMFWILFLEIMRVLKPHGLFYVNAPSSGNVHRYPVDCWRFYPDAAAALVTWGKHNGLNTVLIETQISNEDSHWRDFSAVILKDASELSRYSNENVI